MKSTQLIILFALAIFLGQSCPLIFKPEPRPYVPVPQIFKDYTVFQEGTYWIFQNDSFPAELDSSYVAYAQCADEKEEELFSFDREFCHSKWVYLNEDWLQWAEAIHYRLEGDGYIYVNSERRKSDPSEFSNHLFLDSASMDTLRASFDFTRIAGRYDTLELNGKTYHDVIRVVREGSISYKPNRELYYARNVGIIKRILWDGNSWSLVRSHVIK